MNARELMKTDFLAVEATWPSQRVSELLTRINARWVIVRLRGESKVDYFAFIRQELLKIIKSADQSNLANALALDQKSPSPIISPTSTMRLVNTPHIVVDNDRLLGIVPPSDKKNWGHGVNLLPFGTNSFRSHDSLSDLVSRQLIAELPASIFIGESASLLISLAPLSQTQATVSQPFASAIGSNVDVIVTPVDGFSLDSASEGTLVISEPQSPTPIRFKLKPERECQGSIHIRAFIENKCIADFFATAQIAASRESASNVPGSQEAKVVVSVTTTTPAELSLLVLEDGNTLSFTLHSKTQAFPQRKIGETKLRMSSRSYFRQLFGRIEGMPLDTENDRNVAEQRIAAIGANLFATLFPADLRVLLWDLRTQIQSVQIVSDESWIPWELCRLSGKVGGRIEEGAFLCEAFSTTRWLSKARDDVEKLPLANIAIVVPQSSGLGTAEYEKNFLLSLEKPNRKINDIRPYFTDVLSAMSLGIYDGWHFTGHAKAEQNGDENQAQIVLDDFGLHPDEVSGRPINMVIPRPLVFLNACQSSRGGLALTDVGGWAHRFLASGGDEDNGLAIGASAFIGTLWSVYDDAAAVFAKAFYNNLLEHKLSVGEAAKGARKTTREKFPGDPTWLAYTVYAAPSAKVT